MGHQGTSADTDVEFVLDEHTAKTVATTLQALATPSRLMILAT
ncbi:MAG: hypothetical protein JWM84_3872, partial [Nocardioides sp.]|nr:hypothetical protein [Nocardioides sp.]